MAATAGKVAALYVGASPAKVLGLTDVKFSKNGKAIDVTTFDSGQWEEFILGLNGMSASASGFYTPTDTTGQVVLRDATPAVACEVRWGATTPKVAFSAFVTGFDIDASVSDAAKLSITLQPTGVGTFS